MEKSEKEFLESKGFDIDGTMRRFLNNEALYKKCLKKFLDDSSFEKLKEAYSDGNCNEAFKAAHTMKGFVSNLGINRIYELLIPMVEKLRSQNMDIGAEMAQLEELYADTYKIIEDI